MAETPETGETPTQTAPSNGTGTVAAPAQPDNSSVDVEAAKKQAEQARMEANMLRNQLEKIKAEQEAAKTKQLEEKEEFKTLYEQTQADLERIKNEQAAKEREAELKGTTEKVLSEYPQSVVKLARTAGLSLSDDSEEAVTALKEKLDEFKKEVAPNATPSANNPRETVPEDANQAELLKRMRAGDQKAASEFIQSMPVFQQWKEGAQKGIY